MYCKVRFENPEGRTSDAKALTLWYSNEDAAPPQGYLPILCSYVFPEIIVVERTLDVGEATMLIYFRHLTDYR